MSSAPDRIVPDTKDWTWVLERPCPECGFDTAAQSLSDLPGLVHDTAVANDYGSQEPTVVAVELVEAAGSYHLHDVVHHLHDVGAQ